MASTFSLVTDSSAPPEELFDLSLDIDLHRSSMARSGERAIAGVTTGRIGLGETVTWRARHFGVRWTMTSEIAELDRPHRFVDAQRQGPFRSFRHEHVFERTSEGTRMIDTVTVASPVFGAWAERLVLVPRLRRLIALRNRYLLDIAERRKD